MTLKGKIYAVLYVVFYVINIYNNVISCINCYKNNTYINEFLKLTTQFYTYIKGENTKLIKCLDNYKSYSGFCNDLVKNASNIEKVICETKNISKYNIGKKFLVFYKFKYDKLYTSTYKYCFKLLTYIDYIKSISNNTNLGKCMFTNKTQFRDFYMPIENTNSVKNSCKFSKNMIISGPNASGKTTFVKSVFLNIILSQQIGRGFYKNALLQPYDQFHCYINIPDTNDRDSLFQAEARQCKNILECIKKSKNNRHFIIMDELFSGTNPEQAIKSAHSYLNYLAKNNNVRFLLTTHFYKLCNALEKNKNITNVSMKSKKINNITKYFYKLQRGVSKEKSGYDILKQLDFPTEIINTLEKV
jgi:DNA mismatch repair ATPase MutS